MERGAGAYAAPLGRLGIAVECIPADLQEQFDWPGIAFYGGAAGTVLDCTDLTQLPDQDVADPSVIDPTQLLAEAAVRQVMQVAWKPGIS